MREFPPGAAPADLDLGDEFVHDNKTWRVRQTSSSGWIVATHVTVPPAAPQKFDEDTAGLLLPEPAAQEVVPGRTVGQEPATADGIEHAVVDAGDEHQAIEADAYVECLGISILLER